MLLLTPILWNNHDYPSNVPARAAQNQTIQLTPTVDATLQVNLLIKQGYDAAQAGNYEAALKLYDQAITLARRQGLQQAEADALLYAGLVYQAQKDYAQALVNYKDSLAINRTLGNQDGQATAFY